MAHLSPDEEARLADLGERRADRIETRRQQLESGEVTEQYAPTAYVEIAEGERALGIIAVYNGEIAAARDRFGDAAATYTEAIDAALAGNPWATTFRQVPETCQDALVTAMLAADESRVSELAATTQDLSDPKSWSDDRTGFHPDQYYLAQTLADVAVEDVDESHCQAVAERFAEAPAPLAQHVDGLVTFARGLDAGDTEQLERAINALVAYHKADRHQDNVLDAVLAPEATGLAWLARHYGYRCSVSSDFVPESLVSA